VTSHTYDDQGRLVTTAYPDDTTAKSTYDEEGRRLSSTDLG
jgi:YD repeat-containing protein